MPYAESCDDQIWYGSTDDFEDFPFPDGRGDEIKVMEGAEGYKFLLDTVSGFRSRRLGETHIKSQFHDGWRVFLEEHPEEAQDYETFVADLKRDVKYIQEEVASGLKTLKHSTTARDLSGQKKGDSVLLVASVGKSGLLGEMSKQMISLIENKQDPSKKKGEKGRYLTITHPDRKTLMSIQDQLEKMKTEGKVRSSISYVGFSRIGEQFETADQVYVDMPMGANEEAEQAVIEAWLNRVREDNMLTQIRGNPETRMQSTPLWLNPLLDSSGYIAPEQIIEENTERRERNAQIIKNVDITSGRLAELRADGVRDIHGAMQQGYDNPEHDAS